MKKNKNKVKKVIAEKKFLKQKYRKCFGIVKKHIDELDLMGLLEIHCPKDEYEFEVADIVKFAVGRKDIKTLSEIIIKVFNEAFDENFERKRMEIEIVADKILKEFRLLSPIEKETYFIPKELLPGSCYFEFQAGKYNTGKFWFSKMGEIKRDDSIYLYGDDDGVFEHSAIAPFAYMICGSYPAPEAPKSFDYCGITYIDESDGKELIKNLMKFAMLLGDGKQVYEALEEIGVYNPNTDGSWSEEDSIKKLDLVVLKNTAYELADWVEKTLTEHKWISVLGI